MQKGAQVLRAIVLDVKYKSGLLVDERLQVDKTKVHVASVYDRFL